MVNNDESYQRLLSSHMRDDGKDGFFQVQLSQYAGLCCVDDNWWGHQITGIFKVPLDFKTRRAIANDDWYAKSEVDKKSSFPVIVERRNGKYYDVITDIEIFDGSNNLSDTIDGISFSAKVSLSSERLSYYMRQITSSLDEREIVKRYSEKMNIILKVSRDKYRANANKKTQDDINARMAVDEIRRLRK